MTTPVLLVLLVSFSFAVARLLQRYASRFVVLSGVEYLLVGVVMGPLVLRVITQELVSLIQPLISLLLGMIGFLTGLRAPRAGRGGPAVTVGILSSGAVALGTGALCMWVADGLGVRPGHDGSQMRFELLQLGQMRVVLEVSTAQIWLALGLGAAATTASPTVISTMAERLGGTGPTGKLAATLADTSQWVGLILLGLALALARAEASAGKLGLGIAEWALVALSAGAVCGVLFSFFIGREQNPHRVFLATVGGVIFATGVGTALDISPLFVNLVAGTTVALTSPHAQRVQAEMDRMGHPLFVLTMLMAGAMWQPVGGLLWLLPLVYAGARLVLRTTFVNMFGAALLELPPRVSRGLLAQGIAAVAVAVDIAQRLPNLAPLVLSTVLVGALLSELFSHRELRALLLDAGEHRDNEQPEGST